jgi:hypothetical protein
MAVAMTVISAGAVSRRKLVEIVRIAYRATQVVPPGIWSCGELYGERTLTGTGGMGKWFLFNTVIGVALAADNRTVTIILSVFSLVFPVRWRSIVTGYAIAC